ncbi:hypothetical protein D3C77_450080 [compost metagenome]
MVALLLLLSGQLANFRIQILAIALHFQKPSHMINTGNLRLQPFLTQAKSSEQLRYTLLDTMAQPDRLNTAHRVHYIR